MIINNFGITKDQYDHICHILITTPTGATGKRNLAVATNYIYKHLIEGVEGRIISLKECLDIVKKIHSNLIK